jgi:DNA-directed RNA polymerase specialized sigma24 family protein
MSVRVISIDEVLELVNYCWSDDQAKEAVDRINGITSKYVTISKVSEAELKTDVMMGVYKAYKRYGDNIDKNNLIGYLKRELRYGVLYEQINPENYEVHKAKKNAVEIEINPDDDYSGSLSEEFNVLFDDLEEFKTVNLSSEQIKIMHLHLTEGYAMREVSEMMSLSERKCWFRLRKAQEAISKGYFESVHIGCRDSATGKMSKSESFDMSEDDYATRFAW